MIIRDLPLVDVGMIQEVDGLWSAVKLLQAEVKYMPRAFTMIVLVRQSLRFLM